MSILVKSEDVRSGRKAKFRHGRLRAAQESMGKKTFTSVARSLEPRGRVLCFVKDMYSRVCFRFVFRIQLCSSFDG